MVKSGLESLILKSYVPLQGCCCPVQKKELPRVNEFVCFFAVKSKKTKQIRSFVFWENLWRANLLTVLSDL